MPERDAGSASTAARTPLAGSGGSRPGMQMVSEASGQLDLLMVKLWGAVFWENEMELGMSREKGGWEWGWGRNHASVW